ncbi:MAG: DNA sulfur modification protein DndB [Alphaproteobacteria bacterium]|nr:DNA sulfur modification protein DndB [Alphaproteobacteria bacterium]
MPTPRAVIQQPSTPPFSFIAGMYRLSAWHIPYFAATMTFRDAAANLRLVNEFPGAERLKWRLEELYQRDIDWPRVERQIVPYLRNEQQPQFFNALTVALLPIKDNEVLGTYEGSDWAPPGPANAQVTPFSVDVGAISCSYYEAWTDASSAGAKLGQIRWNPDQVFSVAIDGQHRLAAIKSLGDSASAAMQTDVPVILLVFDPRLGYRAPAGGLGIVDLLRRLFIDLNKHAIKVDRTRQILLDDVDPHSLCVRQLVESKLADGISSLTASPPRLPMSLVDWHTGQAKVDHGPYITTILGLDWSVTRLLGAKPIVDYMDYKSVGRQLDAFRQSLGLELSALRTSLEELRQYSLRPFSYQRDGGNEQVEKISRAFAAVWAPALVRLYTGLRPFEKLISLRSTNDSLTAEFVNWFYLYERQSGETSVGKARQEYDQMVHHLATRASPVSEPTLKSKLAEIEAEKENSLAYTVVFQRALIEAFWHFQKLDGTPSDSDPESADALFEPDDEDDVAPAVTPESSQDDAGPDEDATVATKARQVLTQAEKFVETLNKIIDADAAWLSYTFATGSGQFRKSFWLGALLSLEQRIDFTQGASVRSAELILWGPLLSLDIERGGIATSPTFETFWNKLTDESRDLTLVQKSLERSINRYEKGTADRILKADENYDDLSDAELKENIVEKEVKPRLKWLWNTVKYSP